MHFYDLYLFLSIFVVKGLPLTLEKLQQRCQLGDITQLQMNCLRINLRSSVLLR